MTFRPVRTQILVEYVENKPVGDILLPDNNVTMDYSMFVVRAVGDGILTNNGYVPLPVKVGDRIQLRPSAQGKMHALPPWLVDDQKLAVVEFDQVAGVWEGELPEPKVSRNILKPSKQLIGSA
jgi:co-chaperonin GroES (HSP10)